MSDLDSLVRDASTKLDFNPGSLEALREAVERRVQQRRRLRVVVPLACLTLMVGGALSVRHHVEPPLIAQSVSSQTPGARPAISPVSLRDGSRVEPTTARTVVHVLADQPEFVRVALTEGAASFHVVPNPLRRFVVAVRDLEVEVVGTTFDVICRDADTEVKVQAGSVRVRNATGEVLLSGGDARSFAVGARLNAAFLSDPEPSSSSALPNAPAGTPGPSSAGDWRSLARAGKFAQAFKIMPAAAAQPGSRGVEELLLRSDVARLSGHPALAIDSLRAVVAQYAGDSRTPSASFTLGQIYEQLGRPADAATAFAKSRALQPSGPLVEDALARETLALLAAGDRPGALARARQYLERYPAGVHTAQIRQRTGLP